VTDLDRRRWALALLVVCLVCGALPFLPVLGWLPWGSDASKWVAWSSLHSDTLWQTVFDRKHFVGYRPVAALSYVFNHATTGFAPWGYRLLDLVLHGLSGALTALLVRQWSLERGPRVTGLTALLAFVVVIVLFGHPATEEVVPYSARRSYLLAMCFGVGGLLLFGEALRWTSRLAAVGGFCAAAGLLGLAVLSNESAYVLVPLVPIVGLHLTWSEPRLGRIAAGLGPLAVVTALAIAARLAVLGSLSGGYHRRYFAVLEAGRPGWRELQVWRPHRILHATWSYLLSPHETSGARLVRIDALQIAIVSGGVVFVLGMLGYAVRRRAEPVARSLLVAAAWLVGSTTIIVLSQTWFWRQAYFLLLPYGLLLGVAIREAAARWATDRRRALWFGAPAVMLLVLALVHGPVLRFGMNTRAHLDKSEGSRATLAMRAAVAELDQPSDVLMVVPLRGKRAQLTRLWQRHFFHGAGHRFQLLGHLDPSVRPGTRGPRLERDGDELVLSGGYRLAEGFAAPSTDPGGRAPVRVALDTLRGPRRPAVVLGVAPSPIRIDLPPEPVSPRQAPPGAATAPSPRAPSRR